MEAKQEIAARVSRALSQSSPTRGERGTLLVRDAGNRALIYVCRPEHDELVVVTLWEEGDDAAVPRRFTDALERFSSVREFRADDER